LLAFRIVAGLDALSGRLFRVFRFFGFSSALLLGFWFPASIGFLVLLALVVSFCNRYTRGLILLVLVVSFCNRYRGLYVRF
jgi:hypothetical protein